MLDVAGGIIIAVIVLAIIGKAARYLEKRKAAKLKLAVAHKELQQMNEFVADLERIKKWKVAQARCQYFAKAYVDDKSSPVPEISNKADAMLENVIQKVLAEADEVEDDDYCRSAILHSISDLMCKVGQFERASKLIELIAVDVIREQARTLLADEKKKRSAMI
jgi:hypothetical protein